MEQRTDDLRKVYKRETREKKDTKEGKEQTGKETGRDIGIGKEQGSKEQGVGKEQIVKGFIGKDIAITLRGGEKLKGRLEAVTQYELIITIAQSPFVVMKHAVDYLTLAGEK